MQSCWVLDSHWARVPVVSFFWENLPFGLRKLTQFLHCHCNLKEETSLSHSGTYRQEGLQPCLGWDLNLLHLSYCWIDLRLWETFENACLYFSLWGHEIWGCQGQNYIVWLSFPKKFMRKCNLECWSWGLVGGDLIINRLEGVEGKTSG